MPVLEAGLFEYVSDALSAFVADRVFPVRGPERVALPYVTYQRISAQRENDHDPFPEMKGWVRARVQFNCWAAEMTTAIEIGEALVLALNGYSGPFGDVSVGSADVVFELDDYQPDTKLYRRIVDVVFAYQEGGSGS